MPNNYVRFELSIKSAFNNHKTLLRDSRHVCLWERGPMGRRERRHGAAADWSVLSVFILFYFHLVFGKRWGILPSSRSLGFPLSSLAADRNNGNAVFHHIRKREVQCEMSGANSSASNEFAAWNHNKEQYEYLLTVHSFSLRTFNWSALFKERSDLIEYTYRKSAIECVREREREVENWKPSKTDVEKHAPSDYLDATAFGIKMKLSGLGAGEGEAEGGQVSEIQRSQNETN